MQKSITLLKIISVNHILMSVLVSTRLLKLITSLADACWRRWLTLAAKVKIRDTHGVTLARWIFCARLITEMWSPFESAICRQVSCPTYDY
jgi:hypothetical protein